MISLATDLLVSLLLVVEPLKLHEDWVHDLVLLLSLVSTMQSLVALLDQLLNPILTLELVVGLDLVDECNEFLLLPDYLLVLLPLVLYESLVLGLQLFHLLHQNGALLILKQCFVVNLKCRISILSLLVLVNECFLNSSELVVVLHVDVVLSAEDVLAIAH